MAKTLCYDKRYIVPTVFDWYVVQNLIWLTEDEYLLKMCKEIIASQTNIMVKFSLANILTLYPVKSISEVILVSCGVLIHLFMFCLLQVSVLPSCSRDSQLNEVSLLREPLLTGRLKQEVWKEGKGINQGDMKPNCPTKEWMSQLMIPPYTQEHRYWLKG